MARTKDFAWSEVVDVSLAARSATTEMYGDWFRDPWSWPELNYLVKVPSLLFDRMDSRRARFERLAIPKTNFGTRPAVVQSPIDRMAYHAVANALSPSLIGDLAPFVSGWRLGRKSPAAGKFVRNQQEWLAFIADRREASEQFESLLATDITNFFGSIDVNRLVELVYRKAGKTRPVEMLESILRAFNDLPDRSGIPQRSTASSILANAFVAPVDDVLGRYASHHGAHVARWMDDIWVFGGSHEHLRRLQLDLQDELRNIGLEINLGKTLIREGDEARETVEDVDLEREPPAQNLAASGSPYEAQRDEDDLDRQFERFLRRPERADRTTIRYICARIREFERQDLIPKLIDAAPLAPQGADHFSRLLGRSGSWRDLGQWYVEQAKAEVGLERLPWPIAQLGTMFPSDTALEPVVSFFADALEHTKNPSIEFLAVAAHRLSKWAPADARVLLRSIGDKCDSPLGTRTAAMALHNLGEDRTRVSKMLSEFEENVVTRELLKQYGTARVPENKDFDPAVA